MSITRSVTRLTHAGALRILAAAVAAAEGAGTPHSIAIVDEGCNLLALARMDGASVPSIDSATRKAVTAVAAGAPSGAPPAGGPPTGGVPADRTLLFAAATDGRTTALAGGLPLLVGGQVIGGIGVASGVADEGIEIAEAAAAFFEATGNPP